MNLFRTISLLLIVTSIIACSNTKTENGKTKNEGLRFAISDTIPNRISPDSTVIAFLKWYRDHENSLHQIQLLTGGLEDTATFYSVDFKETERYLSELKKSGYLSDTFLDELRKHFAQANKYLKQHPQNDGPAPGFEADLIMKSQDYMDVWENLANVKVIDKKIDGSKASVKLLLTSNYKTKYYLTIYKEKWLINRIDNVFAEN